MAAVCTPEVLLVPYEGLHVPRYHEWMKSEVPSSPTPASPSEKLTCVGAPSSDGLGTTDFGGGVCDAAYVERGR